MKRNTFIKSALGGIGLFAGSSAVAAANKTWDIETLEKEGLYKVEEKANEEHLNKFAGKKVLAHNLNNNLESDGRVSLVHKTCFNSAKNAETTKDFFIKMGVTFFAIAEKNHSFFESFNKFETGYKFTKVKPNVYKFAPV